MRCSIEDADIEDVEDGGKIRVEVFSKTNYNIAIAFEMAILLFYGNTLIDRR